MAVQALMDQKKGLREEDQKIRRAELDKAKASREQSAATMQQMLEAQTNMGTIHQQSAPTWLLFFSRTHQHGHYSSAERPTNEQTCDGSCHEEEQVSGRLPCRCV